MVRYLWLTERHSFLTILNLLQSTSSVQTMSLSPLVPMTVTSSCGEEKAALCMGYTREMGAL